MGLNMAAKLIIRTQLISRERSAYWARRGAGYESRVQSTSQSPASRYSRQTDICLLPHLLLTLLPQSVDARHWIETVQCCWNTKNCAGISRLQPHNEYPSQSKHVSVLSLFTSKYLLVSRCEVASST